MIQLYLLEKLTHVAIFMNEYVKSHKQYFEQKGATSKMIYSI